jgi:hypothetical protein
MSDSAFWAPLVISVVIFACYYGIDKRLEAAMDQRRDHHRQVMDILNSLPDELDQLKTYLDCIYENTKPPDSRAESLKIIGDAFDEVLNRSARED